MPTSAQMSWVPFDVAAVVARSFVGPEADQGPSLALPRDRQERGLVVRPWFWTLQEFRSGAQSCLEREEASDETAATTGRAGVAASATAASQRMDWQDGVGTAGQGRHPASGLGRERPRLQLPRPEFPFFGVDDPRGVLLRARDFQLM